MEPTALQADELERMAGTARFGWNWALHRSQTFYKTNKKGIPQAQLSNELTALKSEQPWLYDFDSQSLQQVLKNLKQAYQNHFNPSMRAGFPKRKTTEERQTILPYPTARCAPGRQSLCAKTRLGPGAAVSGHRR